jgi:hypothetical protein
MHTLRICSGTFLHTMSEMTRRDRNTQHKQATNITTMVVEPLAPTVVWIQSIHSAQGVGSIEHIFSGAIVAGFY